MSDIDNAIIDRIIILRNEFLQNYSSENRILFGIRNILHNIDEININIVYNHLYYYYTNYQDNLVNLNNIGFLTSHNNDIISVDDYLNFSLNSFDRQMFNQDQQVNINDNLSSDDSLLSDDDDIMSDSEDEFLFDDYHSFPNHILTDNIPSNFSVRTINDFGYTYNNHEINLNSNIETLSNIFNINNFSTNDNLNQIEDNTENIFLENVPIVIKYSSLNKLKVCKHEDLSKKIKESNKKCMINLKDFRNDDIVRVLPCKHVFIKNDIDNWLLNSSYKCPICRSSAGEHYARVN